MGDEGGYYEVAPDGTGKSPITPLGKVVYNAFRDDNLIREFRRNVKQKTSIYPGPVDDDSVTIFPREIVFKRKTLKGRKSGKDGDGLFVVSTVAGLGDEGVPLYRTIEDYEVVGVSVTRAKADATGNESELDVVVQTGGSTTLKNTGIERIENGDIVYAEFPDPRNSYERGVKGSERQPWWSAPLRPEMDLMTRNSIIHALTNPSTGTEYEMAKDQPLIEGAELLNDGVRHTYLQAAHVLQAAGIMKFTKNALDLTKKGLASRIAHSKAYMSNPDKDTILSKLATFMGACGAGSETPLDVPGPYTKGSDPPTIILSDYITRTYLADDDSYNLVALQPGTNAIPRGTAGDILRKQKSNLEDNIAGVNRVNRFKTRRVLGKALSPADPGTSFEILLGRYQL